MKERAVVIECYLRLPFSLFYDERMICDIRPPIDVRFVFFSSSVLTLLFIFFLFFLLKSTFLNYFNSFEDYVKGKVQLHRHIFFHGVKWRVTIIRTKRRTHMNRFLYRIWSWSLCLTDDGGQVPPSRSGLFTIYYVNWKQKKRTRQDKTLYFKERDRENFLYTEFN